MYICVHKNSLICLFTCTLSTGQTIPVLHLLLHLFPETIATIQPSHPTVAASRAPFSFGKASLKASLTLHWWQVLIDDDAGAIIFVVIISSIITISIFMVMLAAMVIWREATTPDRHGHKTQWNWMYRQCATETVRQICYVHHDLIRPSLETPMIFVSSMCHLTKFQWDSACQPSISQFSMGYWWPQLHCRGFTHTKSVIVCWICCVSFGCFSHVFFNIQYEFQCVPHVVGLTMMFTLRSGWRWLSSHSFKPQGWWNTGLINSGLRDPRK